VASVAALWRRGLAARPALAEGPTGKVNRRYEFVSPEYFSVFGVDLVADEGCTTGT
jgi:hypothetical protein